MHGLPEDVPMRPKTPLIWHLARRGGALSEETDVMHHPSSVIHRPFSIIHHPSSTDYTPFGTARTANDETTSEVPVLAASLFSSSNVCDELIYTSVMASQCTARDAAGHSTNPRHRG